MTRQVRPLSLPDLELRHPQTLIHIPPPAHGFGDLDDMGRMVTCITGELSACRLGRMRESSVFIPERSEAALLGVITLIQALRTTLGRLESEAIEEARDLGASWRDLAAPLGVGGRAAAERKARRIRHREQNVPATTGDRDA